MSRYYGFDPAGLKGLRGHRLPMRKLASPLSDGNVLLVGDAAGLLDPLTGEGIFAAIWSGRAAAGHIAEYAAGKAPDLRGYARQLERELLPELPVSRRLYDLLYLSPATTIRVVKHVPGVWPFLCEIVRGGWSYGELPQRPISAATFLDLASDLVRRTPRWRGFVDERDPPPPERFLRLRTGATAT